MQNNTSNELMRMLLLIGPMLLIFYFLIIRPQQKQQKKHQEMLKTINKNDVIVTTAGIHGTVVNVKDKTFILRVDENAKIEIDKSAVAYIEKQRDQAQNA
ncbi:MAG: preprotein translocase subunit YajC [Candidatus Omnitrophica bacterium]|nr:preprotein translocase subunit YajC [Candidatus Omnitrophota bacterium]